MLEALRNSVNTWVAKVILGLLILAFALWGVEGFLAGGAQSTVARVGETKIETQVFATRLNEQLRAYQQQTGQVLSISAARDQGYASRVLDQLATRAAISEEARIMGVSASDADIARMITEVPRFQIATGFEQELYEQFLYQQQRTARDFEADIRTDLAQRTLLEAIATGASAPRALSEALHDYQSTERGLDYILLTPESADDPGEPTEDQIASYHTGNPDRFTAPEYRSLSIVWLTSQELGKDIEVTEDELIDAYEERSRSGEFTTAATRTLEQILFDSEDEARAAYDRVQGGTSFAEIAQERDLDPESLSLGTIEAGGLTPQISGAAFAATEAGVLKPVKTGFGSALINVTAVTGSKSSSLDDVRDQIRIELGQELARDRIIEEMVAVDDELAGGSTPSQAAQATGARFVKINLTDAQGLDRKGEPVEGLPPIADILPTAFEAGVGEDPIVIEADGGGFFGVTVDSFVDSQLRKLDEVRDDVIAGWKLEQRTAQLEGIATDLRSRVEAGETIAGVAEAEDYSVVTAGPIRRTQRPQHMTEALRDGMFSSEVSGVLEGRADNDAGYVIGVVTEVEVNDEDAELDAIDQVNQRHAAQISTDLIEGFTRSARERHPLRANAAAVDAVLTELGQYY